MRELQKHLFNYAQGESMLKLKEKIAVITGGASGMGLATVAEFVREGATVVIIGRNMEALNAAKSSFGDAVYCIQADISKLTDIERAVLDVKEKFKRVDILFANAATAKLTPFDDVSENFFDNTVSINFKGSFFTIQKFLKIMPSGSSIIVTTSITNLMGSPHFSVYAATKSALKSLVQTLGLELAHLGIRINAISPGPIDTPMVSQLGEGKEAEEQLRAHISQKSPMRRWGKPEEIAKAALFLANNDSSYITGQEIVIDGGMSLL